MWIYQKGYVKRHTQKRLNHKIHSDTKHWCLIYESKAEFNTGWTDSNSSIQTNMSVCKSAILVCQLLIILACTVNVQFFWRQKFSQGQYNSNKPHGRLNENLPLLLTHVSSFNNNNFFFPSDKHSLEVKAHSARWNRKKNWKKMLILWTLIENEVQSFFTFFVLLIINKWIKLVLCLNILCYIA